MKTPDQVRARLAELVKSRPDTDYVRLAELLGKNLTYVQQFVTKGTPKRLHADDRRKLARYFGVPEHELGGPPETDMPATSPAYVLVGEYDLAASAGDGAFADGESQTGYLSFRKDWLRSVTSAAPEDLGVIAVHGDSMDPFLRHGDRVLVDTTQKIVREDGVYVIDYGDVLQIKRVSRDARNNRISISSDNSAYRAYPDLNPSDVRVIGRVIWLGRRV